MRELLSILLTLLAGSLTVLPLEVFAKDAQEKDVGIRRQLKNYSCPVAQRRYSTPLQTLGAAGSASGYGLILGDSVVFGIEDPRIFGLADWIAIGQNSQTTKCLLEEVEWFTDLRPDKLVLYIGGNDVDRRLPTMRICANVAKLVLSIRRAGVQRIYLSEIHGALTTERSPDSVEKLNDCYAKIASIFSVSLLTSPLALTFQNLKDAKKLSWDGEHLNNAGYRLWLDDLMGQIERLNPANGRLESTGQRTFYPLRDRISR